MIDTADRAGELIEHQQADALARHHRDEARRTRIAESMRPATLGPRDCDDCGDEIDPARLRLLPFASRCTACGTRAEALYREKAWMPT